MKTAEATDRAAHPSCRRPRPRTARAASLPVPGRTARAAVPGRAALVFALFFLLVLLAAPLGAIDEWHRQYDERTLQAADDLDIPDLVENPTEIDFDAVDDPSDDIHIETYADVHAVYPVPFQALRDTILDVDSHRDFVPRVVSSDAERTGDDPPSWRQQVELEFRVVVFSADYVFETEHLVPRHNDDELVLVFRMVKSHDEFIADTGGSWYLKRIDIEGKEHTYVRYFNHVAFGEHMVGLRLALRNLGLRDVKSVMDAYYEEALTR